MATTIPQGAGQPTLDSNGQIANIDMSTLQTNNAASSAVSGLGLDLNTVINQLNNEVGSISSSSNTIDSSINAAINSQKEAASANQARIESQYGRESNYLLGKLTNERTSLLENSRGGAVSGSALILVDREIDKNLKDLDQRKNELILAGNAEAASKIADLQIESLRMKMDVKQKQFTNLLGLGQFAQSVSQSLIENKRAAQQMTIEQLKYNLDRQQQIDYKEKTIFEQADATTRTNILKREIILKEAAAKKEADLTKVAGSPGWKDAAAQLHFGGLMDTEIAALQKQQLSPEAMQAALVMMEVRYNNLIPDDIGSKDAIHSYIFGDAVSNVSDSAIDVYGGDNSFSFEWPGAYNVAKEIPGAYVQSSKSIVGGIKTFLFGN